MNIDLTAFFFNSSINVKGSNGTTAWGTSIGHKKTDNCRIDLQKPGVKEIIGGMIYKCISDTSVIDISKGSDTRELLLAAKFDKVYLNGERLENQSFLTFIFKEHSKSHEGRIMFSFPIYAKMNDISVNKECIDAMKEKIGCNENGCWFVHDISIKQQDEIHFTGCVVKPDGPVIYNDSKERSKEWGKLVKQSNKCDATITEVDAVLSGGIQKLFYGSPGTGKSHKIKETLNNIDDYFIIRTTFHPDSDYSSFVGSYKPIAEGNKITYSFEPQCFMEAYIKAWENPFNQVYLIIEEINRGNCAQIFGDIFQLLDRKDGYSEYKIKADQTIIKFLNEQLTGAASEGISNGMLCLPNNLNIIATMNTSDQSLFPMDSAFKRRWAWEYIPINEKCKDSQFKITIGNLTYPWSQFISAVNKRILKLTQSEDKQLGNFFIKNDIDAKEFKGKVMFYLWSEVCKEYYNAGSFFKYKNKLNGEDKETEFTFSQLFDDNDTSILQGFMSYLDVKNIEDANE